MSTDNNLNVNMPEIKLKVMEAVQDDVNKGIVKIDSNLMKQINVNPGDILEINGERKTAALVDRAYPGDIGLNIIRMDGNIRRNAKTSIGEIVTVKKAEVKPAKKITIAPAQKGIMIKAHPAFFKQGLMGKALIKGDLVSLGRAKRRMPQQQSQGIDNVLSALEEQFAGLGFGDLKLLVLDTDPKKEIVVVNKDTFIDFRPQAVDLKEEEAISLGINYEDIGGLSDEIKKVREMVELPLKHPEIFEKLGIEAPKGVLLHGPPGTGKTLLAKAVASETNSHFILINGPEVMSKFYGESEKNLRKKFDEAEQNAPSIIFIDEIDAIATKREETKGDVEKRVVAQMLGLMDGLKNRGKVIVIAATNMPNVLDPALRRPGRFDREIEIGVPDKKGRLEVIKIHTRNMPLKGSLYGNILSKIIPDEIKLKRNELNYSLEKTKSKLNHIEGKIKNLNIEISKQKELVNSKKNEILELEKRKQKSDENILLKILESVRGLKKQISELEGSLISDYEELSKLKSKKEELLDKKSKTNSSLEEIIFIKSNLKERKKNLSLLVEEIKNLDKIKDNYNFTDPRRNIVDNNLSSLYLKLENIGIVNEIVTKARKEGINQDLSDIAKVTHGFVGADLNALAKEAAMIVLRRILPDLKKKGIEEGQPIPPEILAKLMVHQKDFKEALKVVRPSAMREVLVETPEIGWENIGGLEEVKNKLKEAVEWPLKHPERFKQLGIRPPRGVLLYGPPGTGKTLLAKAVAKESEANFILVNGPSLLSKWVGESEKAMREIFRKARQTSPTILFFDEIDALVPRRGRNNDGSQVTEKMVNQMLTEMDGLENLNDVLVIAATNRPDMVDPALLRQGRFDQIIYTPVSDEEGRKQIFEIYLQGMPIKDVDAQELAKRTESYVGSDIEGVCREAAMCALREDTNAKEVTMQHFNQALEIVKPSVDEKVQESYQKLKDYFSSARAKQIEEKADYFG